MHGNLTLLVIQPILIALTNPYNAETVMQTKASGENIQLICDYEWNISDLHCAGAAGNIIINSA